MHLTSWFNSVEEKDKTQVIHTIVEHGTPDFDYHYMLTISSLMAIMGILLDNVTIIIGAMLVAPIMHPVLGLALGAAMMRMSIIKRSLYVLIKSIFLSLTIGALVAFVYYFFYDITYTGELLAYSDASIPYFFVAAIAGAAIAYVLAKPEWNSALPGIAVSVAFVPPTAATAVGIALFDTSIIFGGATLLIANLLGIAGAAAIIFTLMDFKKKGITAEKILTAEHKKLNHERMMISRLNKK